MTIPANLARLVFFMAMLWPGLTYTSLRERRSSDVKRSVFREAVDVIRVSLLIVGVLVLFAWLAHLVTPGIALDPARLLFDTTSYARTHLGLVAAWIALAVVLSQLLATIMATGWVQRQARRFRKGGGEASAMHESLLSAWWLAFTLYPESQAVLYVGCQLTDGSFLAGPLHSFSRNWEDSPDRDLVIEQPIRFRPPKSGTERLLDDVGLVVISARNIAYLTVSYLPPDSAGPISRAERNDVHEGVDSGASSTSPPP